MPRFFSVVSPEGERLTADPKDWRAIAARIANALHTPLRDVLAMDWCEGLLWWREADRVHSETFGLLTGFLNRTHPTE